MGYWFRHGGVSAFDCGGIQAHLSPIWHVSLYVTWRDVLIDVSVFRGHSVGTGFTAAWEGRVGVTKSVFWLSSACVCRPGLRTGDDLEIIYDELLHIKALAHLSNTVSQPTPLLKRQYVVFCFFFVFVAVNCLDWLHMCYFCYRSSRDSFPHTPQFTSFKTANHTKLF